MTNFHFNPITTFLVVFFIWSSAYVEETLSIPKDRVMTTEEFKQAINNYEFFRQECKTVNDQPLDEYEVKMIESAIKEENSDYGGEFDHEREISNFTGDTLLVGGGKKAGKYGENQGKTVLSDYMAQEIETNELIENLRSGKWAQDPYIGKKFKTDTEKELYIKELERKKRLYKKAFNQKNKDILSRYYTLNLDKYVQPDMLASITSIADMNKIPDDKFMCVEFENVPCHVFLNPSLYTILKRITKPQGKIKLSVTNACRRLIAPVIQPTVFGAEFAQVLTSKYSLLERLHPTYHRLTFIITNKK